MKLSGYCKWCKKYKKIKGINIDKDDDLIMEFKCKHLRIVRIGTRLHKGLPSKVVAPLLENSEGE